MTNKPYNEYIFTKLLITIERWEKQFQNNATHLKNLFDCTIAVFKISTFCLLGQAKGFLKRLLLQNYSFQI